jgi:hypothetical protein
MNNNDDDNNEIEPMCNRIGAVTYQWVLSRTYVCSQTRRNIGGKKF